MLLGERHSGTRSCIAVTTIAGYRPQTELLGIGLTAVRRRLVDKNERQGVGYQKPSQRRSCPLAAGTRGGLTD
jgi:hypothetical protein